MPVAVFQSPETLEASAAVPMPVFSVPLVLLRSALKPIAVFAVPVVIKSIAWYPKHVFWFSSVHAALAAVLPAIPATARHTRIDGRSTES
jgi:hypothetical protein